MDHATFDRVVNELKDRIYSYAVYMTRDPADAQQIAQESFLRLWQHKNSVAVTDPDGNPTTAAARAWLLRTTHNLCVDRARQIQRAKVNAINGVAVPAKAGRVGRAVQADDSDGLFEQIASNEPDPERAVLAKQSMRELMRALGQLSETERSLILMREFQQMSYKQLAELLDAPMGTVKVRLHRARLALRKKLRPQGVN